jgi:hypothetical protein
MSQIVRAPHAVDTDSLARMAVTRYKELRDQIKELDAERKRVAGVLGGIMREADAAELTVGGLPIARLTEFDREDVSAKALRIADPELAERLITVTPIVRVDVP